MQTSTPLKLPVAYRSSQRTRARKRNGSATATSVLRIIVWDISEADLRSLQTLYYEDGILSVAAASNDGTRSKAFPASYDSVISVAATEIDNNSAMSRFTTG